MISFKPLRELCKVRGVSLYSFEGRKIIGKATTTVIRADRGNVNTSTINAICKDLNCQPGDLIEYIPDEEQLLPEDQDKE